MNRKANEGAAFSRANFFITKSLSAYFKYTTDLCNVYILASSSMFCYTVV